MQQDAAIQLVIDELTTAMQNHGPMSSPHEGYAIIKEELDELWDDIKNNQPPEVLQAEAKQLAAMAVRFLIELT